MQIVCIIILVTDEETDSESPQEPQSVRTTAKTESSHLEPEAPRQHISLCWIIKIFQNKPQDNTHDTASSYTRSLNIYSIINEDIHAPSSSLMNLHVSLSFEYDSSSIGSWYNKFLLF